MLVLEVLTELVAAMQQQAMETKQFNLTQMKINNQITYKKLFLKITILVTNNLNLI